MLPKIESIHTVVANILSQVMACVANLFLKPIGYQTNTANNKVTYPTIGMLFLSLVFFVCNVALLFLFLSCDRVLDMVLVLVSSILVLNMSVFMSLVFDEQRLFSNNFFPNKSTHLLYIDTKIAFSLLKKLYHHFLPSNGFDKVRYNC